MSGLNPITFFISSFVQTYNPLNLTAIPEGLANNLGIDSFSGGILASGILLFIMLVPMSLWEKEGMWGKLIIGLIGVGFCIAIEWLPQFFMIIIVIVLALMLSGQARDWISGGE
jgi:hypothetical protein